MKKKLVIMRHGETVFNQKNRNQGWVDSPLTQLGIKQAQARKGWIEQLGLEFDHAYASTSERACDTLELVSDMPYQRRKGLKEINFGAMDGEPAYLNPPVSQYSAFFKAFGGETREEACQRLTDELRSIMDQEDHINVLAVSHGGVMRNFQRSMPIAKQAAGIVEEPKFLNCIVLVFEYDTDTRLFTLVDYDNSPLQTESADNKKA